MQPAPVSSAAHAAYAGLCVQHVAAQDGCRRNLLLAIGVVMASMLCAFGLPGSPRLVFLVLLPLFVAQYFAGLQHAERLMLGRACRAASAQLPVGRLPHLGWLGAALAVREGYFLLLLAFDAAWLGHAYLLPLPAASWADYLARLEVGPLTGRALVALTLCLWIAYGVLFLLGQFVASHEAADDPTLDALPFGTTKWRIAFSLGVQARQGTRIRLNGHRLARPGAQALILWPGFFQNGFVFDLIPGRASLAEYLWEQGFDIWILHPRGTAGSEGRDLASSLDDYAATDVPAIVSFVASKVATPPILVGHSQGGITAILSLMGASFDSQGASCLSDSAAQTRQDALGALVTLGSFPSFVAKRERNLQRFVRLGIPLLGQRLPIAPILAWLRSWLRFVPLPVDITLRRALLSSWPLRVLLLPLSVALEIGARLAFWEFLYHIPNVSTEARRHVLSATIDGTFTDILAQFYRTVGSQRIQSLDGRVDYSEQYHRLRLPLSVVAMELDGFVEHDSLVQVMIERASSAVKLDHYLPSLGHEDPFMAPGYFPQVLTAIRCVCQAQTHGAHAQEGHDETLEHV